MAMRRRVRGRWTRNGGGSRGSLRLQRLEDRRLLAATAMEVYAWTIVNTLRADPAQFADDLAGLRGDTSGAYVAHGYSGNDPVWDDIRDRLNDTGNANPQHYAESLALMRATDPLPPIAFSNSLQERSADHNAWMQTHCFAHSTFGSRPPEPCIALLPGFPTQSMSLGMSDPDRISGNDLGDAFGNVHSENIGSWRGDPLPQTRMRFGSNTNEFRQRLAYFDIITYVTEVNSANLSHLQNLLAENRNAIGIDYFVRDAYTTAPAVTVLLSTHTLSRNSSVGGYLTGISYDDANSNQYYDIGEETERCVTVTGPQVCTDDIGFGAISSFYPNGNYVVSSDGGSESVTIDGSNIALDFPFMPVVVDPVVTVSPAGPNGVGDNDDLGGGDQPTSWASQRSSIRQITIGLPTAPGTTPVATDLVMMNRTTSTPVTLSDSQLSLGGTTVTVNLNANQMPDGVYDLTVKAPMFGGSNDYTLIGDNTNKLFVKQADWNGDSEVNLLDFSTFRYWFGTNVDSEAPLAAGTAPAYVDLNGDGEINLLDFSTFRTNFGTSTTFPAAMAPGSASVLADDGMAEGESMGAIAIPMERKNSMEKPTALGSERLDDLGGICLHESTHSPVTNMFSPSTAHQYSHTASMSGDGPLNEKDSSWQDAVDMVMLDEMSEERFATRIG